VSISPVAIGSGGPKKILWELKTITTCIFFFIDDASFVCFNIKTKQIKKELTNLQLF
jgi:hypothetical protein